MTREDGNHGGFPDVVGKFTSHTVQNPQNEKWNLKHTVLLYDLC